jgi:hypothetical protein
MTRLGKIARLPRKLREELNVRLQNGEVGTELVEWLNGLEAAQKVLKARFEGRPISEQNLSEWKQGGYEDWGRHQENCAYAAMLMEMSSDLEEEAGEKRLEERLVAPLAMGLARLLREAEEMPAGPERHKMILEVARQLSQLRRDSLQAERVKMERERWDEKLSEICQREAKEVEEEVMMEEIWERTKAEHPALRPLAELKAQYKEIVKTRRGGKDKPRGARHHPSPLVQKWEKAKAAAAKAQEREVAEAANEVGQTETDERDGGDGRDGRDEGDKGEGVKTDQAQSSPIKPNQTKSNLSEGKMDLPEGKEGAREG